MMASIHAFGQASVLGNAGAPGNYLGWNNLQGFPLDIRHDGNQPIDWYTDAIQRVTLSPTYTGQAVNGYTGVNLSGFLGIGLFTQPLVDKPQALLHQDSGWRPWMKQGTYITYTSDQAYLGLKAEANGSLECVDRDFSG